MSRRLSAPPALWQHPWLRVSMIIKRLQTAPALAPLEDCGDDLATLHELRATIERSGWFN